MKNFKRKIARLFGLALRSDLKRINEAYEKRDEEAKCYYNIISSHPDFLVIKCSELPLVTPNIDKTHLAWEDNLSPGWETNNKTND